MSKTKSERYLQQQGIAMAMSLNLGSKVEQLNKLFKEEGMGAKAEVFMHDEAQIIVDEGDVEDATKLTKVILCGSPSDSDLVEKLIEMQHSTTPGVHVVGRFDDVDAPVLEEVIKKLSEERQQLPVLALKNFDLAPVDTTIPDKLKKTRSYKDKKYF